LRYGFDSDGTIIPSFLPNPSVRLPWWLFILFLPAVFFVHPKIKTIRFIRKLKKEGKEIFIVSARPKQILWLTERYFRFHNVPYDKIYCLGFGKGTKKRKLSAIRSLGIQTYYDNDPAIISFLIKNSVDAKDVLKIPSD
jgi:hypothetical protein